jgi:hypothetical protein
MINDIITLCTISLGGYENGNKGCFAFGFSALVIFALFCIGVVFVGIKV